MRSNYVRNGNKKDVANAIVRKFNNILNIAVAAIICAVDDQQKMTADELDSIMYEANKVIDRFAEYSKQRYIEQFSEEFEAHKIDFQKVRQIIAGHVHGMWKQSNIDYLDDAMYYNTEINVGSLIINFFDILHFGEVKGNRCLDKFSEYLERFKNADLWDVLRERGFVARDYLTVSDSVAYEKHKQRVKNTVPFKQADKLQKEMLAFQDCMKGAQ